ncbi:MAG: RhuM family protein [Bacteroidota bacterium]
MGLKAFKNANRDGKVLKSDVTIAKNFLSADELTKLNLLVSMFLDHAESIVLKGDRIMKMADWEDRLDRFLVFNEHDVLQDFGKVKKSVADAFAEKQYEKFKVVQDRAYRSDFNNVIDGIKSKGALPTEEKSSFEISEANKATSEFDQKLVTALNYTPNEKKERKPRATKPVIKECPVCGKECDKKAKYCDGNIEIEGENIPCQHIF